MADLSKADIVLCVVLGVAFIYGTYRGLILQIASLGGLIAGFIAARMFSSDVALWLGVEFPSVFSTPKIAAVTAMCMLFIAGYLAVALFGRFVHKLSHALLAAWLDHLAGGVLGLVKALIFVSLLINLYLVISPTGHLPRCNLLGANTLWWIAGVAPKLFGIATEHFGV